METRRVIYPYGDSNGIAILYPTGEVPFEDVCLKDVPEGVPFKIIDQSDIPQDDSFRDAWEADFSNPDGYGMGHYKWLEMKNNKEEENTND